MVEDWTSEARGRAIRARGFERTAEIIVYRMGVVEWSGGE